MRMHQSETLYIVTRNLIQNVAAMWKSVLIANFGQNYHRNTKNLVKKLKKGFARGNSAVKGLKLIEITNKL